MIALLVALTGTVLQLHQDVALLRDQMSNLVVSKEFAAFKAAVRIPKGIAEQHDEQYEKRLEQIEKKLDELRK